MLSRSQSVFEELITQPLDDTARLRLSVLCHTVHVLGEPMQGCRHLLLQFLNGLPQGGEGCLLLLLLLAGDVHKLLPELLQLLLNLIPLALIFQRQLEFQRFETLMDVAMECIHRGRERLVLSVGRK